MISLKQSPRHEDLHAFSFVGCSGLSLPSCCSFRLWLVAFDSQFAGTVQSPERAGCVRCTVSFAQTQFCRERALGDEVA